jgi:hypothetical protein
MEPINPQHGDGDFLLVSEESWLRRHLPLAVILGVVLALVIGFVAWTFASANSGNDNPVVAASLTSTGSGAVLPTGPVASRTSGIGVPHVPLPTVVETVTATATTTVTERPPVTVLVPDVFKAEQVIAVQVLRSLDFRVNTVVDPSLPILTVAYVQVQDPAAGSRVAPGTTVTLHVNPTS